jgi:hypothetical protein
MHPQAGNRAGIPVQHNNGKNCSAGQGDRRRQAVAAERHGLKIETRCLPTGHFPVLWVAMHFPHMDGVCHLLNQPQELLELWGPALPLSYFPHLLVAGTFLNVSSPIF